MLYYSFSVLLFILSEQYTFLKKVFKSRSRTLTLTHNITFNLHKLFKVITSKIETGKQNPYCTLHRKIYIHHM